MDRVGQRMIVGMPDQMIELVRIALLHDAEGAIGKTLGIDAGQ